MKKALPLLLIAFISFTNLLQAQAPQTMNYQAVVRDHSGNPLAFGINVTVRFTIHDQTANGTAVFTEVNTAVTNQFGLITQKIGGTSNLSVVNWSNGPKFLQVEIDPAGGSNFTDMGTSQLLSVPYALYAGNAAAGATGPQGPIGPAGSQGATGPQGAAGPQGSAGPQGPTGLNGTNGVQGAQGPQGQQGPAGPTGTAGAQGIAGLAGTTGPAGPTGAGVAGPSGPQGNTGPTGPAGSPGAPGTQGPAGAQGPAGTQGPAGATGPTGAPGASGATGTAGTTGATGPQGSIGSAGPQGLQGAQGLPGTTGPTGADGLAGPTGPSGSAGTQGPAGAPGAQGPAGPQGPAGANGSSNVKTYYATGTTDESTSSSGYSNLNQMNLTFTPLNSTVFIHFSAGGTYTNDEEHNVWFSLVVNGSTVKTFLCHGASLWNTYQAGFDYPLGVSAGSSTNVSIQWATDGQASYTIYNYCATYPNQNHNRSLIIYDHP